MRTDLARVRPPVARKRLFVKVIPIITRFAYMSIWIRIHMDINGYGLYHKVIEGRERFHWPRLFEEDVVEMTSEQLCWLMDGYDVWSRPHKAVTFTHVR